MIAIVVLAAGESRRLGQPKQLLKWEGRTLVRRMAEAALQAECRPVVVVLGANATAIRLEVAELPVVVVENVDWAEGMAGSLRVGLEAALARMPDLQAILMLVCDQPFVTSALLGEMVATYRSAGMPIVACEYGGTHGVPALFDVSVMAELLALRGAEGARKVIARDPARVVAVAFPEGSIDLDTPDDVAALSQLGHEPSL